MTPRLALCMPFYRNSLMLAHHYATWAGYRDEVRDAIEVLIVDDGSPEPAAAVPRPSGLPALRIFRVPVDRPWHQHAARNIAAHEAVAPWLLLTDMDHVVPEASLVRLFDLLDRDRIYTFHRLDAPNLRPKLKDGKPHPHVNTFAIRKARYWQIGGYDERLCGFYGTDGYFRRRLYANGPATHLDDIHVVRYPREVIPDASTSEIGTDPKVFRDAGRRPKERAQVLAALRPGERVPVLLHPWERAV